LDIEILKQRWLSYSGLALFFFVLIHLAGIIYGGINPELFEKYASNLHSSSFLPYLEIGLTVTFVVHMSLTINKTLKNRSSGNTSKLRSKRNDNLGVLASKLQPLTGIILAIFLLFHLSQLRFPRPSDNMELLSLKDHLGGFQTLILYSFASISLFFHMVHGIESGHRSVGILSQKNSLQIRYFSRLISFLFGMSYLIMTFYLRFH
tara:strand:- start:4109 stop:4726 length:618 start_codon:yes stop_codon:yes gene_type:complete